MVLNMKIVQFFQANIEEGVSVQHDEIVGLNLRGRLAYSTTGEEGCCLLRIDDLRTSVRCSEIGLDALMFVARRQDDATDTGLDESVDEVGEEGFAIDGRHGFGHIADDVTQTGAEPSG